MGCGVKGSGSQLFVSRLNCLGQMSVHIHWHHPCVGRFLAYREIYNS